MTIQRVADTTRRVLASRWFFIGLVAFFIFQATWIALSAKYPMAFDEDFHLGIIKIYANQWSPFLSETPANSAAFGAITNDPSYLFHYLMSFPYRIFMGVWHNETVTIILLRLLDVALAAWSIVLYNRVLKRARVGRASAHTIIGLFIQLPIFALMAGQINYDNALLVCVAGLFLLAQRIIADTKARQPGAVPVALFVALCMFGSLIKYAFLPIAVATVIVLAVAIYRSYKKHGGVMKYIRGLWACVRKLSRVVQIGLVVILVIGLGLFSQRYMVNLAMYHTPIPSCDSVLDTDTCEAYGPWARDHHMKLALEASGATQTTDIKQTLISPFEYMAIWLYGMWYRLFFMINGNLPEFRYQNSPSLPLIGGAAVIIAITGFVALGRFWKRVVRGPVPWVFVATILLYTAALWWQNFGSFRQTGNPVAVNGRYLLPILVPLGALMITGMRFMVRNGSVRAGMAVLSLVLFLSGNSLVSFIVRSNDHWYWDNATVRSVNHTAQSILDPIVWHKSTPLTLPQP